MYLGWAQSIGNSIHFFVLKVAREYSDAEFRGVNQFLQKGAQDAHFRPFWTTMGPKTRFVAFWPS